jgi:Tol biopolymer transport system component
MSICRTAKKRVPRALGAMTILATLVVGDVSPSTAAFPGINGLLACQTNRLGVTNNEVFTFGANGTEVDPTNVTNHPANDFRPRWRSDGRKIAFESSRAGGNNIFVMDADGSNVTQVTFTGDASSPAWHPDGSQLLYQRNFGMLNFDVYKVNVDGSSPTPVSPTQFEDSLPFWSPDGTTIAFSSRRLEGNSFGPDIYTMDSFGNNVTNITNVPRMGTRGRTGRPTAPRSSSTAGGRTPTVRRSTR